MSSSRAKQDQEFWSIVADLRWRLDEGHVGQIPQHEPEFMHGAGVRPQRLSIPSWVTHAAVLVLGVAALALVVTLLR